MDPCVFWVAWAGIFLGPRDGTIKLTILCSMGQLKRFVRIACQKSSA